MRWKKRERNGGRRRIEEKDEERISFRRKIKRGSESNKLVSSLDCKTV